MKKNNFNKNFLKASQINYKNATAESFKTTNINILLNRVRANEQIEFKKRMIFSFLIIAFVSFVAIYFVFR